MEDLSCTWMEGDIFDGIYGSMHYRKAPDRRFWKCYESSDYSYTAVMDDFGDLIPVGPITNMRGY
jgi:hypothetical protein